MNQQVTLTVHPILQRYGKKARLDLKSSSTHPMQTGAPTRGDQEAEAISDWGLNWCFNCRKKP